MNRDKFYKLFGEYDFGNYGSIDILENSESEMFYTEAHEYTHRSVTGRTPFGVFVMLLRSAKKHDNLLEDLQSYLIALMKSSQESISTFTEYCLLYEHEGEEHYKKEIIKLKQSNNTYYQYFSSLEFLLEFFSPVQALEIANNIINLSFNVDLMNLPNEVLLVKKERTKFFSNVDNIDSFSPNRRFKCICKSLKKNLHNKIGIEESRAYIESFKNDTHLDSKYLSKLFKFILNFYSKSKAYPHIEAGFSKFNTINEDKQLLMVYPTLLKGKVYPSTLWKPQDIKLIKDKLYFSLLSLSDMLKDRYIASTTCIFNKNHKSMTCHVAGIKDNEIIEFINNHRGIFLILGGQEKSYKFIKKYINESSYQFYQFIDHAVIDSINYFNENFSGGYFRIFNYMNKFSIMVIIKDDIKILQPISLRAYSSIINLVTKKELLLNGVTENDQGFDDYIIKSKNEKKELDLLISVVYFNLFQ